MSLKGRNYKLARGQATTRKKFLPGARDVRIAKFSTGTAKIDYDWNLKLITTERVQVRDTAIEATRVAANKKINEDGFEEYFLMVKKYPHIILRENKMIATAGADRLQEGMRKAYGKPTGMAARVSVGDTILELSIKNDKLDKAKLALKLAASKFPAPMKVVVEPIPKKQ